MKFDLNPKKVDFTKVTCLEKAALWLRAAEVKENNNRSPEDIDMSLNQAAEYELMAFDGRK